METDFETLLYEERDGVAWVTLNRPDRLNAFNSLMQRELHALWRGLRRHDDVRCVVLTGAGEKAFCTGGDQSAHEGQYDGRGVVGLPIDELQGLIRDVPKPVIARVNGFAIGGGNVLATLCDLTIAADTAQIPYLRMR